MPANVDAGARALREAARARKAAADLPTFDNMPPRETYGAGRVLAILAWIIGWPALSIWVGMAAGAMAGLAVLAFVLFTFVLIHSTTLADIRTDGYALDKAPDADGKSRWRIGVRVPAAQVDPTVVYLDDAVRAPAKTEHPNKLGG